MDEELDGLVVRVRADREALARDIDAMRGSIEGVLGEAGERAGRRIEQGLLRAVRTGKFGFEDLRRIALSVLDQIAASALKGAIGDIMGGQKGGGAGLLGLGTAVLGSVLGLPGRATGGPVAPGRAYLVGERGPEVFVPTSSGQVATGVGGARDVRVSIAVRGQGEGQEAHRLLARSARQVARAVKGALEA